MGKWINQKSNFICLLTLIIFKLFLIYSFAYSSITIESIEYNEKSKLHINTFNDKSRDVLLQIALDETLKLQSKINHIKIDRMLEEQILTIEDKVKPIEYQRNIGAIISLWLCVILFLVSLLCINSNQNNKNKDNIKTQLSNIENTFNNLPEIKTIQLLINDLKNILKKSKEEKININNSYGLFLIKKIESDIKDIFENYKLSKELIMEFKEYFIEVELLLKSEIEKNIVEANKIAKIKNQELLKDIKFIKKEINLLNK